MEATKILMFVAVVAVVVAGINVISIVSIDKTGYASSDVGNLSFQLVGSADINFTRDLINWSSGAVDTSPACTGANGPFAVLTTTGAGTVSCGTWTPASGLVVENIGNSNVTLLLRSNNNATDGDLGAFVGGTHDLIYNWIVLQDESGSCNTTVAPSTFVPVNWTSAIGTGTFVCPRFHWANANDALKIDFNVTVPNDAPVGSKLSVITAEAAVIGP